MEQNPAAATLWRMWVDTKRRIVSFHEEKDCQLLEFRSHEMFLAAWTNTPASNTVINDPAGPFRPYPGGFSRLRRLFDPCGKNAGQHCCVSCWPPH